MSYVTDSQNIASPTTTILIYSCLAINVILPTYPHKLCVLICYPLSRVTLGHCTGRICVKKNSTHCVMPCAQRNIDRKGNINQDCVAKTKRKQRK